MGQGSNGCQLGTADGGTFNRTAGVRLAVPGKGRGAASSSVREQNARRRTGKKAGKDGGGKCEEAGQQKGSPACRIGGQRGWSAADALPAQAGRHEISGQVSFVARELQNNSRRSFRERLLAVPWSCPGCALRGGGSWPQQGTSKS